MVRDPDANSDCDGGKNAGGIGSERVGSCNVNTAGRACDTDASGDTGIHECGSSEGDCDRAASGAGTARIHSGLCDDRVLAGGVCDGAAEEVGVISLVKPRLKGIKGLWRVSMAIAGTVPPISDGSINRTTV
jgi:hypothetical protein